MNYLSIGAVFRLENSWLEEWIVYHRLLGVERFYLYSDDRDTHVCEKLLEPYIATKIVDLRLIKDMNWLGAGENAWHQKDAYKEIIRESAGKTHWLALIDLDEFLLPRRCDDLRVLLQEYERYSGLAVHWNIFGTSGHITRPPSQINHLLHRAENGWYRNQMIKSIVRPDKVDLARVDNVHYFQAVSGDTVDENGEIVRAMGRRSVSTSKIRLNHYVLRSLQDFWEVKAVRNRSNEAPKCDERYFNHHDRNEVFDDEIARRFGRVASDEMKMGPESITTNRENRR